MFQVCVIILKYKKVQPPYRGLHSSSCGWLRGPSSSKVILADKRMDKQTDRRTKGLRKLDSYKKFICIGFPRTGILPVSCHFEKKLCLPAVAKPDLHS